MRLALAIALFAMLVTGVALASRRGVNGVGVIGQTGGSSTVVDPGCYPGDTGQRIEFCTGFALPDGAGYVNTAKVLNGRSWTASGNGHSEGCVVPDASFAPGDGFLHQTLSVNPIDGAPCYNTDWPDAAAPNTWAPPTPATTPFQPTTSNPLLIATVQSKQYFHNQDGGAYVLDTYINNANINGQDNSIILYSSNALGCDDGGFYLWACQWQKGYYNGASAPTFWEIDLTIGVINLFLNGSLTNTVDGGLSLTSYGSNIPGSCNTAAGCHLAVVIIPGVVIQAYVDGVSMGQEGAIYSIHVPSEAMFLQCGTPVVDSFWPSCCSANIDQKLGTFRICDYTGVPHC